MELEIEQKIGKRLKSDKDKKLKNFRLTDRDLDIFGFILEQKFCSLGCDCIRSDAESSGARIFSEFGPS